MNLPRAEIMATPQQIAAAADVARRIEGLGKGGKGEVVRAAALEMGCSPATLYRLMQPHTASTRKQRSDAGALALTLVEAEVLSAYLMETFRQTGRRILSLTLAVEQLRANGLIQARRVDLSTGEILPLSDSSISRALRAYNLHPEQLTRPTPHTPLSSPYPNYCWQVDASVCVVFYLPMGKYAGGCEIVPLDQAIHYKNKPENLRAIERFRVIRYVGADHNSGAGRWRYYPHAESGAATVAFLAWMMAPKATLADPMHGAPEHLMIDPGATSAALVRRFCHRMTINLIVNKPGNPRAKGSVEKLNHLVETTFESGLKFQRHNVRSIEELNSLAEMVQLNWNATAIHSRHGKTRFAQWMTAPADKIRRTRDAATLLSLATETPATPTVTGELTVRFKGREFRVNHIPQAVVKAKLTVCWNPFEEGAMAVVMGADGHETHIALPEAPRNASGFIAHSAEIASQYLAPKDTVLETNRKRVAEVAAGTTGLAATEKARAAKDYVPMKHLVPGGVDPYKAAREAAPVTWLPKRGQELDITLPTVEPLRHSATQACMRIQQRLGTAWRPEHYQWVMRRFKEGATDAEIEALARQFLAGDEQQREAAC